MLSKKGGAGGEPRERKQAKQFTSPYRHKDSVVKLYYISPRMCLYSKKQL